MRVAIHGARPMAKTNVVVNRLKAEQTGLVIKYCGTGFQSVLLMKSFVSNSEY
jgi:hypothetical protein